MFEIFDILGAKNWSWILAPEKNTNRKRLKFATFASPIGHHQVSAWEKKATHEIITMPWLELGTRATPHADRPSFRNCPGTQAGGNCMQLYFFRGASSGLASACGRWRYIDHSPAAASGQRVSATPFSAKDGGLNPPWVALCMLYASMCVSVCVYYVCVCTSRYAIMYARMHACMHACVYARLFVCLHPIMPAGAYACTQGCMPTCCSYTSIMFNRSDPYADLSCFPAEKKQCHQATRQPSRDLRRGKSSPLVSCLVWLISRFHLQTSGKDYPNS